MKTARQVAVEALMKVDGEGGYSQIVLDHALKRSGLQSRDKGFATALFYGVLERRITLDHYMAPFVQHKLTLVVREILRISFYQLIFMPSVPGNAVVNEAVELTRMMRQPGAAKMVNGILRGFIRKGEAEPLEGDRPEDLEVAYSCPRELVSLFLEWHGLDHTKKILLSSLGRPQTFLHVNTLKGSQQQLQEKLKEQGIAFGETHLANALSVDAAEAIVSSLHREGYFHIQDLSSQMAVAALAPKAGERVLDLCAAPGSKSFTIAEEMQNTGTVVSCDLYPHKLELITNGAVRLGITIIEAKHNDGTKENDSLGKFDRILCDVPCSGLGIIRRKPEIKYKSVESFRDLPNYQYKILETASNYLKEGGTLVYSTCTINPNENELVVKRFLASHPEFVLTEKEMQTILPDTDHGDGFFIAAIRRK